MRRILFWVLGMVGYTFGILTGRDLLSPWISGAAIGACSVLTYYIDECWRSA